MANLLGTLLRFIRALPLHMLELIIWFNPDIESVVQIVQTKVTKLVVRDWALTAHWIDSLPGFHKLAHAEIQDAHKANASECQKPWTAILILNVPYMDNSNVLIH